MNVWEKAMDDKTGRSSVTGSIASQNLNPARWPRGRVNTKGKDMRPEELSRRDSMKVAHYEVLGWRSEKATRPGRDDRRPLMLVKAHAGNQEPNVSIVPGGTRISFCTSPSTSYWATFIGSLWDRVCSHTPRAHVDAHVRLRGWATFVQSLILLLSSLGTALADGGAVQLHATAPPFVVTVFTDPPQCRAGQVDLSALVQEKNGPVLDAEVVASLSALEPAKASPTAAWLPPACASTAVTDLRDVPLQISHGTNRLFYSAEIQIPYDGRWQLKVSIRRGTDRATLQGILDVDRSLPPVTAYWQWFLLPFLAIGGFVLKQHIRKPRKQESATTDF
jgi:hypothetical protein